MQMTGLLLLWLIPALTAIVAARRFPNHIWQAVAMSFGAVAAPASMGLYSLYYLGPPIGYIGLLGLPLMMIHSWPGYYLALATGLVPDHTVIEGIYRFYVDGLNGMIWLIVYGTVGTALHLVLPEAQYRKRET